MSDTTPRLALPELVASQAQKHVTHNEALIKLDCLVDLYFVSMALSAPPSSPSDGDACLVASGGSGDWSGYDGKIAYCIDGAWRYYTPTKGMRAYNAADGKFYVYTGSAWVDWITAISLAGSTLASGKFLVGNASGAAAAVAMSGDATMGNTGAVTLAASGVTAGTYKSITVDAKGRVTAGTNPTTVSGFGITDAVTLTGSQTLTNKTLTTPTIGGTLTVAGKTISYSSGSYNADQVYTCSDTSWHELFRETYRSRGTYASPTAVQNGDYIGISSFYGYTGSVYTQGAGISVAVSDSVSAGIVPMDVTISTMNSVGNLLSRLVVGGNGTVRPGVDNTQTLGASSYRWSAAYVASGTINTSDERVKTNWASITDAHRRAALRIKTEIGLFQFIDAVEKKGVDGARIHCGVKAQAVWRIMIEEGLEQAPAEGEAPNIRHAFICYDKWDAQEAVDELRDEDGAVVVRARPAREAGEIYGIRADELLLFLIAAL